jgi:threonine/homoserine/homoserine lactone efflux protein
MLSFIPDSTVVLTFAVAAFVLFVTPGPDMALFLSRTINYGRAHGLVCQLGSMTGNFFHSLLAAFGISLLLATIPAAFLVVKIAGALYLLWLAFNAIRSGNKLSLLADGGDRPTLWQSYLSGVGINLLNPKVILFFVTFLPQFVDADDPAAGAKIVFLGLEYNLISLPLTALMVLAAHRLTRLLVESRWVGRALNYSFAAVFATFAAVILTAQARHG